jgi:cell division protein FtsL
MNRDHIKMLLNIAITASNTQVWTVTQEQLEHFANLIAKNERDKVEAEWRYLMVDARKASEQALEALENVRKHDIENLYGLDKVISGFRASLNMGPFNRGDW